MHYLYRLAVAFRKVKGDGNFTFTFSKLQLLSWTELDKLVIKYDRVVGG